ncbi:hypothetical protein IQ07DRAFT_135700 [Pyrenochaeta sp. DS3sAY3a]|nr:hypothetical protein IQ07DRAFT_135700 [Pyrenochaeta sp. DS3sAY3a]
MACGDLSTHRGFSRVVTGQTREKASFSQCALRQYGVQHEDAVTQTGLHRTIPGIPAVTAPWYHLRISLTQPCFASSQYEHSRLRIYMPNADALLLGTLTWLKQCHPTIFLVRRSGHIRPMEPLAITGCNNQIRSVVSMKNTCHHTILQARRSEQSWHESLWEE